jgi:hypothetical protein
MKGRSIMSTVSAPRKEAVSTKGRSQNLGPTQKVETVIEHVLSRFKDIGISKVFGVAGDFAFHSLDLLRRADHRHARRRSGFSSGSPRQATLLRQAAPRQPQALHIPSRILRAKLEIWNYREKPIAGFRGQVLVP